VRLRFKQVKERFKKKPKFAQSHIAQRLLMHPPVVRLRLLFRNWSCAIYSIVNWMVAYSDEEFRRCA
jgi:hypothetical protein